MQTYRPTPVSGSVKRWIEALEERKRTYKGWRGDFTEFALVSLLRAEFVGMNYEDDSVKPILEELEKREKILAGKIYYRTKE